MFPLNVHETASDLSSLSPLTSWGQQVIGGEFTQEEVRLRTLDEVYPEVVGGATRVALKIDVQGHERLVLRGAEQCIDKVVFMECECPLMGLYKGAGTFAELVTVIEGLGFAPVAAWSGYVDHASGFAADADVFFVRQAAASLTQGR
jgi:hypothetical protein